MEQYINDKKIVATINLEEKTPMNNDMVQVCFEDLTKEVMPKVRFELLVTNEPSNASDVMQKLKARVGAILFGTLHEYGIKWGEVNSMSDAMVDLVNNGFKKASDVKWGYEKELIPLIEVNKVLVEDHGKQTDDTNVSSTTGSGPDTEDKG